VVLGASLAEGLIVPFLGRLLSDDLGMKRVAVDRGAIPFVTSGADVMRPGIVRCDSAIAAGDLVLVVDEAHGKPLAVGTALHPGSELVGGAGKGVKVLHYVGDEVWSFAASGG
jgi:PUA domain protein